MKRDHNQPRMNNRRSKKRMATRSSGGVMNNSDSGLLTQEENIVNCSTESVSHSTISTQGDSERHQKEGAQMSTEMPALPKVPRTVDGHVYDGDRSTIVDFNNVFPNNATAVNMAMRGKKQK